MTKFKAYSVLHAIAKKEHNLQDACNYLEKYCAVKESVMQITTSDLIRSYNHSLKVEMLNKETDLQQQKYEIVNQKNKELDTFFHRISHDIKAPVNSLMGLNNLLSHEAKDEMILSYVEKCKQQIEQNNRIVTELSSLTQLNFSDATKELISFSEIIEQSINSFRNYENFHEIRISIQKNPDITFYSQQAVVRAILQNLIENGIKYADIKKTNPFLKISIKSDNKNVYIIVEDNGIGIKKDIKYKVFNMFFRDHYEIEGTGLGLYIFKTAVEQLGGTYQVSSELGKGSVFSARLPKQIP